MTLPEINAAHTSLDRIYTAIRAEGKPIPKWIREILHDEYNRLTDLKQKLKQST